MALRQVELLIAVIVAIVISVLSSVGTSHYLSLKKKADRGQVVEGISRTTSEIQADMDLAKDITHTFRFDLLQGERDFLIRQSDGETNDETVASRADQPVPVSVRDNFKARRLARERSQRATLERLGASAAPETVERDDLLRGTGED